MKYNIQCPNIYAEIFWGNKMRQFFSVHATAELKQDERKTLTESKTSSV